MSLLGYLRGKGKNCSLYIINVICTRLDARKSKGLPKLLAISGFGTASTFGGKGKTSFWQAWMTFEDVTDKLVYLAP